MSISSSLAAGVSGLSANAERLASISDNISNSSTFGYKRSETDFHTLVVNGGAGAKYNAGGVTTTNQRLVDQRGQLQTTSNATDIAIKGRGFLPVTDLASVGEAGNTTLGLTTTGSFRPNAEGILVNATGKVLLGVPARIDGTFPVFARDSADGLKPVNVYHNQFSANPTTEMGLALNLPSVDSETANIGAMHDLTVEYFGNLGQTEQLTFGFKSTANNAWQLTVTEVGTGAALGTFDLTFNDMTVGGGTLASVSGPYDPTTGEIELTVGGTDIKVNIGKIGGGGGITQLNSTFAPSNIAKNGSSVGNFAGVEIDQKGVIHAIYDSGFTRPIYQVPVVDVPNANGLTAMDAGTYEVSLRSGGIFLWDAGSGPVGETAGYTREASTTDVAMELTQLIQTQRAYSSNAKVIQTVDEMLQETTNLKR